MGSPRVIAITGGKGGVGKTSLSVNLAIALARSGKKVCLFDADTGLANVNIMLGLHPAYTLEHLFTGEKTIHEIVLEGPEGIHIIPGASGFAQCVDLDLMQQQRLVRAIKSLEADYDYLLIDTAAGISPTVLHFVAAAQVAAIVVTPEPTSLTDSFSLLKVLRRRGYRRKVQVIVNMVPTNAQAEKVYRRFSAAVKKYLDLATEYMGCVWMDESMRTAVTLQRPVALFPKSDPSARSFYRLTDRIDHVFSRGGVPSLPFSAYWQKLVERSIVRRQSVSLTPLPEVPLPETQQPKETHQDLPEKTTTDQVVPAAVEHSGAEQPSVEQESAASVHYVPQRLIDTEEIAQADSNFTAVVSESGITPAHGDNVESAENVESRENKVAMAEVSEKPFSYDENNNAPGAKVDESQEKTAISAAKQEKAKAAAAPLSADAEEAWIDLRIRLNDFVCRSETTPEQVTTLLSSCIFNYGERLGGTAVDLIHGLLQIVDPASLGNEQRAVLAHEFARLQGIEQNLADAGQHSANDTLDQLNSDNGKPGDAGQTGADLPLAESREVKVRSQYDEDEFGSQQALVEKIRASSGRVPLESILESIKYASLVDSGTE